MTCIELQCISCKSVREAFGATCPIAVRRFTRRTKDPSAVSFFVGGTTHKVRHRREVEGGFIIDNKCATFAIELQVMNQAYTFGVEGPNGDGDHTLLVIEGRISPATVNSGTRLVLRA